jgi:gliding motility-associated-like protein
MRIFLLLSLFLLHFSITAQDFTNKGKDFWIGYGNHVRMYNQLESEKMQLYITSDVNTSGSVKISGITFNLLFSVRANEITTLDIPRLAGLTGEGIYDYGIHVTADDPVVVYSFIYVNAVSGATLCLPTNTLGRDYYSINYHQVSNENESYSYFFVVAADTGTTTVQITPATPTTGGHRAGVPYTVNLKQGQVYQVLSLSDLTGSSIRSISNGTTCKRIAVFCGSGKISIGCQSPETSDNLYQQMYPVSTWGKTYITTPSINSPDFSSQRNLYRVFKSEPAAQVKVNGNLLPANVFVDNKFADIPAGDIPNFIESDKPILVAQYFTTQGCSGNRGQGDPEMIYLNPVEQTISKVTLNSMQPSTSTNINQHYINVVLKNKLANILSFKIDGLNAGVFGAVPSNPEYAFAQIPVSRGTHTLEADSGFNAIAYGFGNAESYGYSAGTNLKDLYQFISIQNKYAIINFPAGCRASPFRFSMTFPYQPVKIKWAFNGLFADTTIFNPVPDSVFTVNGRILYRYTLNRFYVISKIGTYPITLFADNPTTDGCSGEQEINYDLQIFERPSADFSVKNSGCVNDPVELKDVTDGNGRSVIRWNWDFGDGVSNQPSPVHRYKSGGEYLVKFSAITDVGCVSDTIQKQVVLSDQPFARFTPGSTICEDQGVRFTDLSVPAGNIKSWTWDFGDGTTSKESSPLHIFKETKSYNVSLVIETKAGCVSEKDSMTLEINPVPSVHFILPEICLSDPFAVFQDSSFISDGSAASFRYGWNFGDAASTAGNPNISADKNPRHQFSKTGVYDIALTVTSKDGCKADTTRRFTVNGAFPKADFEIKDPTVLCSNKDVVITDKSTVDFGSITRIEIYWNYQNDPADKTIDESPRQGKTYNHRYAEFGDPRSRNYQLLYVAYSGINCINQVTKEITVLGSPRIEFDAIDPVCEEVVPFPLLSAREVYRYTGTGSYSGPGIASTGLFNPALARDGVHTIGYTYTASNGCAATGEQQIVVLPTPVVNAGPDIFLLEGESVTINASADPTSSYLWLPEVAIQNNAGLTPTVSPLNDITYRLQVKSPVGCTGTDAVTVRVLKKVKPPNAFSPNGDGINDTWRIEHLDAYPGATVEVFNRYGQQVYFSNGYNRPWDGNVQGKPLPGGTYYWIIEPKNGREQMKGSVTIIR